MIRYARAAGVSPFWLRFQRQQQLASCSSVLTSLFVFHLSTGQDRTGTPVLAAHRHMDGEEEDFMSGNVSGKIIIIKNCTFVSCAAAKLTS